jgi:hypothetical protein
MALIKINNGVIQKTRNGTTLETPTVQIYFAFNLKNPVAVFQCQWATSTDYPDLSLEDARRVKDLVFGITTDELKTKIFLPQSWETGDHSTNVWILEALLSPGLILYVPKIFPAP